MANQHGLTHDNQAQDQQPDKECAQKPRISSDLKDNQDPAAERSRPEHDKMPAAGPHARPELTDNSKTPGTGALPDPGTDEDSTTG